MKVIQSNFVLIKTNNMERLVNTKNIIEIIKAPNHNGTYYFEVRFINNKSFYINEEQYYALRDVL